MRDSIHRKSAIILSVFLKRTEKQCTHTEKYQLFCRFLYYPQIKITYAQKNKSRAWFWIWRPVLGMDLHGEKFRVGALAFTLAPSEEQTYLKKILNLNPHNSTEASYPLVRIHPRNPPPPIRR